MTLSAWTRLSPGSVTLRPLAPHPASCTEKAEAPNTGSRGLRLTRALLAEAGAHTGDSENEEGRQPGAEARLAGSWTVTRVTDTAVSCSSSAAEDENRDCKEKKLGVVTIPPRQSFNCWVFPLSGLLSFQPLNIGL